MASESKPTVLFWYCKRRDKEKGRIVVHRGSTKKKTKA
jgi:hypothetical protein